MVSTLEDVYSVLWPDLRFLRRNWLKTIATTLITPALYIAAFGYGLGRGISVEGYGYLEFIIPGIIALTAMTSSYNGAALKLHVDRIFYKCFNECLMSPISLSSIIVGKTLVGVVRGLISTVPLLIVGFFLSPLMSINPLFVIALIISFFVFSSLGVLIALWAKSHSDFGTFGTVVVLPMTFLSGTFFSVNQLPEILKVALYILPLTHSSLCLRAAALGQPFPWPSLAALLGFGLAFFVVCVIMLKQSSA